MPSIPPWVKPAPQQMHDLHWLAYSHATRTNSAWAEGIWETLNWIIGEGAGPITERTEQPVTPALAQAEQAAAIAVDTDPGRAPYPLRAEYARLDITPAEPVHTDRARARGVERTLRWLQGVDLKPPAPIPHRAPDGHVLTADELYDTAITERPYSYELPEQRDRLRTVATKEAALSRSLANTIENLQRQLTASNS